MVDRRTPRKDILTDTRRSYDVLDELYNQFVKLLEAEDKEEVLDFVHSNLSKKKIDIVSLYDKLLVPSLNRMVCEEDPSTCIWKEHIRSSIIRAIIESCYKYVFAERDKRFGAKVVGKVLVICPMEEYHELGARVVSDFFTICGFETKFVGANTPKDVVLSAVQHVRPKYVAISVTNYYNLFAAQKTISLIRSAGVSDLKIIVGGNAFRDNQKAYQEIGADRLLQGFDDIVKLREE